MKVLQCLNCTLESPFPSHCTTSDFFKQVCKPYGFYNFISLCKDLVETFKSKCQDFLKISFMFLVSLTCTGIPQSQTTNFIQRWNPYYKGV